MLVIDIENVLSAERKRNNIIVNEIKIYLKMKNKCRKKIRKYEKTKSLNK